MKRQSGSHNPNYKGPNQAFHRSDGVTEIILDKGLSTWVDTVDYHLVAPYRWHAGTVHGVHYATTWNPNKRPVILRMHRLLLPESKVVDHINHDGLDNRRSNLRATNQSVNSLNRSYLKSDGVYKKSGCRKCWVARISVEGRVIRIGGYYTKEEAVRARKEADVILANILAA